jgi:hypothetical protein
MRRSVFALLLVFSFLLLGGCISQSYTQKVDYDGKSVISNTIDLSVVKGYYKQFGFNSEEEFAANITSFSQEACGKIMKKDKTIICIADGLTITLNRNFTSKEGYYSFAVIEGVPYKIYRLTVNKIPADKFGKSAQGLTFAGYSEPGMVNPIDLKKKEENSVSAQGLGAIPGFSFTYSIELPGEVTSATAGTYQADISGSTAKFDMVKVMANSAPLVVESRELNVFLIAAGFGFFLLVLLAAMFFMMKKRH